MENEQGKLRINRRGVGCLLLPLFLLLICLGSFDLMWGNSDVICFGTPFPSKVDVENRAYLKFPATSKDIEYHASGVNRKAGCTIWAKFDMQPSDLSEFMKSTMVKQLNTSQLSDPFPYFMEKQKWVPGNFGLGGHDGTNMEKGDVSTDQWIWVDTSNPAVSTIYIIVNKEWL